MHTPEEGPRQPVDRTIFLLTEAAKYLKEAASRSDWTAEKIRAHECADACIDAAYTLSQGLASEVRKDFDARWKSALEATATTTDR